MTTPVLLTAVESPAVGPAKPHADCCRDVARRWVFVAIEAFCWGPVWSL